MSMTGVIADGWNYVAAAWGISLPVVGGFAMSHEIRYEPDIDCVVLRVEGVVTIERIREMAVEVACICKEKECHRLLNDMSVAVVDVSIAGLFNSPTVMDESNVSRSIKRALVIPSDFNDAEFLENVSRNRGHNLMVFKDVEEAKTWLFDGK